MSTFARSHSFRLSSLLLVLLVSCESFTGIGLRVGIEPEVPGLDDALVATILASPVSEDGEVWTYTYQWSVNEVAQADLTDDTVPADRTELGDVWTVDVTATDGVSRIADPASATVALPPAFPDLDGDGYTTEDDCDDTDPAVNPAAVEACNGVDDDCNGTIDDGTTRDFRDDDGDGYTNCSVNGVPGGDGTDCNDANAAVHPGADEVCNGNRDDDCDGVDDPLEVDDDGDFVTECAGDCDDTDPALHPLDLDADGASSCDGDCDDDDPTLNIADEDDDASTTCDGDCDDDNVLANGLDVDTDGVTTCGPDGVFGTADDDCDDDDINNFPGNPEICDDRDNDCDGVAEIGTNDLDLDNYTICDGDCDDGNAHINPGETEVCNGVDDDCINGVDDGFPNVDNDGFADCLDCDDNDPTSFPGGIEVCDGADNDCANGVDDPFDFDNDGVTTCGPDGIPGNADDDCDDNNANLSPIIVETCDGVEEDCDGVIDNGFDVDGDLFTTCGVDGITGNADDDCNDNVITIFPGATETIDGLDQDCDGIIDEYTWTQIQTVLFTPFCGCHNGTTHVTGMVGINGPNGYATVVGAQAFESTWLRIDPNNSAQSYMLAKIEWTQGSAPAANGQTTGVTMPFGAVMQVDQDHRTGMTNWIDAGAPDD
jgi:hypothetical protein